MSEYIKLPDGSFLRLKEGESPLEGMMAARQLYPELFKTEEEAPKRDTTGFKAAMAASKERLGGEFELLKGKLGVKDVAEAQKEFEAAEARAKARFTPTEEGWSEAPWQKFKETLGGSIPYMVAPAAAGVAALTAPVSAPTAAALGLLGAGAVSTGQFTGSNLARQMETGKTLDEASLGAAVGAAVPQALLDTAAMALMPGIGKLFGSVGTKLTTEQAKAIASQTLGRTLVDYAAKTGAAMGREGVTETTQQLLERLQAGLSITDPDARKEYIESFIGGAALAGAGAPIGRAFERGAAKEQAAKATREERAAAQQAEAAAAEQARAAQEAEKNTPEYALQLGQQYDALLADFKAKRAALKNPGKDATPVEKAEYADAQKEVRALNEQLKELTPEYRRTKALREQAQEQARLAGMTPEEFMLEQMGLTVESPAAPAEKPMTVDEMGRIVEAPETAPKVPEAPAVQQYAQQQAEAMKNAGVLLMRDTKGSPVLDDYVAFLMQDPAMADQMVKTRTKMPDLSRKDNEALLDALRLQLKEQDKLAAATAKEGEARAERIQSAMAGQAPGSELLGAMRQQPGVQAAQEARAIEEARLAKVTPEVEALQRIAERPVTGMDQIDLSGIAPSTKPGITPPEIKASKAAPTIKRRVEELFAQRDQALQDMRMAAAAGERAATEAAIARGEEAKQALNRLASEDSESAPYASAFVQSRNAQEKAFMELQDTLDMLRRGATLEGSQTRRRELVQQIMNDAARKGQQVSLADAQKAADEVVREATTTRKSLQKQADERRSSLINAVLEEAALHRRAQGLPAISTDEAVKAADEINTILEEAITRMQSTPVKGLAIERAPVLTQEAKNANAALDRIRQQIKTTNGTLRSLREEQAASGPEAKGRYNVPMVEAEQRLAKLMLDEQAALAEVSRLQNAVIPEGEQVAVERDPRALEERPLRSPLAAFGVFQEQINNIREGLINPERAAVREEPLLRQQFATTEAAKVAEARGETAETLGGELRRRTEYVRNKMSKMKGMRPAAASVLNEAADLMDAGRATRDLLDAVEPVVDTINRNTMPMQTDLRAVKDAITAIRKQAAEGETVGKIEGQRELFTERQDRDMTDRTLGVVRTTAERFANAPAVKKAKMAIMQAEQAAKAAQQAAEERGRVEAAKLEKTKERAAEKAVSVEAQRRDLQQAILNAMAERRDALKAAAKAQSPQVVAAQKALNDAKAELTALQERVAAAPNVEAALKETALLLDLQTRIDAAQTQLDQSLAEVVVAYDGKELVAAAHQDSLVQFEQKALAKLEKELAKLEKAANPEQVNAAQREIRVQRARVAEAENAARVARETADREKRQLEQRMLSGLGLPGMKRVAGEMVAIKDAKQAQLDSDRQKARDNLEQAMDALEGRPNVPQVPRATGPVTRVSKQAPSAMRTGTEESKAGETRTIGEMGLSEARKPAKSEKAITGKEVQEANVAAAEIKPAAELTERQKKEAQQLQKQQTLEAKERLETVLRRELADLNTRITAVQNSSKPSTELLQKLNDQKASVERQIVAARRDVERAGKEEKKAQKVLDAERQPKETRRNAFSRGTPVEGLTSTQLRTELNKAVGDDITFGKKVSVHNTVQEFLDANPDYDGKIPYDAKGFVDPDTGLAHLFAENIAKGEGLGVLLHEVGVHIGFRNFFNAAQFNAIAKTVRNWATAPANTLEGKIGRAAAKRVKEAGTPAAQVDDELIAYAVEEAVKAGVEPAGVKGGSAVQNWLRMIVNAFNKALETLGLAPEKLKVGDLVNMAYGAAQLELKGTWHGTGTLFKEFDHAYMGSGEGTQAFGWGTYRAQRESIADYYRRTAVKNKLDTWYELPAVKKWIAGLVSEPFYKGLTFDEAVAAWKKNKQANQDIGGALLFFENSSIAPVYLTEKDFRKDLAEEFAAFKKSAAMAVERHKGTKFERNAVETLRALNAVDIASFNYVEPPANLRALLPKGSLLRTLHGAREQAYLLLDAPITAQSSEVVDGLRTVFESLTPKEKQRFNRHVAGENNPTGKEVYDAFKLVLGDQKAVSERMAKAGIVGNKFLDRLSRGRPVTNESKFNYVDFLDKEKGAAIMGADLEPVGPAKDLLLSQVAPDNALKGAPRPTGNESVLISSRVIKEDDDIAWEDASRVGAVLIQNIDRLRDGQKGRATAALKEFVDWADANDKKLVLMPSGSIAGSKDALVSWYVRNGFVSQPDGAMVREPVGPAKDLLFSRTSPNALTELANKISAEPQTFKQRWGKLTALEAEMQGVDMRAGLRDALKAGAEGLGDPKMFTQALYNVLKADQKMPLVYTVMSNGPLELYKDDKGLHGVRSTNKNSAVDVFSAINELPAGDSKQKMAMAQAYLVAQRAMNKGLEKLDFGALGIQEADLQAALDAAKADKALGTALEKVRRVYNAYNKGMIDFLAATGAIPKAVAEKLNAAGDYVPFYRVDSTGKADLVFTEDAMVTIGDIRRQPYLAELKGGETRLLPLDEAIPRNTILLTDKALTNMATKDVAYGLQAIGKPAKKMLINKGSGPADPGVIRFNQEPDPNDPKDTGERWLKVDTVGTLAEGVPTELLVKSLEGAHLPLPGFLKVAGAATDILRAGVTRTPLYIARQLLREPMAAAFTGGLNYNTFTAVLKGGKNFVQMLRGKSETEAKLLEKGLIQSGIFTGDVDDMGKFALQLVKGNQNAIEKLFASMDRYAIKADSATRAQVYDNALANGLSEVEADMMTMESMNFYKRGLSPTIQYASRLIPFFNAQIQGLNVLYKAATGKMPFEERQQIKRKFFNNAVLLTATGIIYAMAMEDDETWRNARPRDKMSNFFLPIPGTDEMLKLPIPFEAGYFYSLAVAAVDGMREQTDNKAQWQAIRDLFLNSIPGYSSMGVPQIVKPLAEVWTNKNFLSGAPIESLRLQGLAPEERYNATTTEFVKMMSRAVPVLSPIQIEHIVRGYLGVLPLAAVAAANGLFEREGAGEKPEKRLSEMALVGSAFQKKYGGADADVVFEAAKDTMEARTTLNKLMAEGRREEAIAYRNENRVELAMASAAGQYRQLVGRINADLRRTQERTDLTAAEKRQRIDRLEEAKQQAAARFLETRRRAEAAVGG